LAPNSNSTRGYIGVIAWDFFSPLFPLFDPLWPYYYFNILYYTFSLSLVLALINLLPFPPLDGDKFISVFIKSRLSEQQALKTIKWIRIITAFLFLTNILLSIAISGFNPI
jgi:membrane-associated protease RseP (regulator of RpoE activity)